MARMIELTAEQFANIIRGRIGKEEYFADSFDKSESDDPDKIVNYSKWVVVKHVELDKEDVYIFNLCGIVGNKYLRSYMDDDSPYCVEKMLLTYMKEVGFTLDRLYWDTIGEMP